MEIAPVIGTSAAEPALDAQRRSSGHSRGLAANLFRAVVVAFVAIVAIPAFAASAIIASVAVAATGIARLLRSPSR